MAFKREKEFLKVLCKGYIEDLIQNVGWTPLECSIIRKKYIEHLEIADIVYDCGIAEATYVRYFDKICAKLQTYMKRHRDADIAAFY